MNKYDLIKGDKVVKKFDSYLEAVKFLHSLYPDGVGYYIVVAKETDNDDNQSESYGSSFRIVKGRKQDKD